MIEQELLNKIKVNEFDYALLRDQLRGYQRPDAKIRSLIDKGFLIRLQRSTFTFGPAANRGLIAREVLANIMYRPSYISLDYALSYYQLIPEAVRAVTNISTKRNRTFNTPLGVFSYQYQKPEFFKIGFTQIKIGEHRRALIATPEKSLLDKIILDGKIKKKKI